LKNVVINWCDGITLKIHNEKPIKSMRIKAHLDIRIMYPLGTKNLTNEKKIHFRSNSNLSKVHNYHLIKVSQEIKTHLTL
jgi:hypothetical protein